MQFTLSGLIRLRADQARRGHSQRYPCKASVRLDRETWTAVHIVFKELAPELTESEKLRVLLEYAAIWAPLRDEMLREMVLRERKTGVNGCKQPQKQV